MRRSVLAVAAVLMLAAIAAWAWFRPVQERAAERRPETAPVAHSEPVEPQERQPTLYCEFTNFADRNPRVGFYFAIERRDGSPVYAQIFRREADGTQIDYGTDGARRPAWAFDGSDNPATFASPEDETVILVYDYDPKRAGAPWFEAGLRSNEYKNLGGKCRLSST